MSKMFILRVRQPDGTWVFDMDKQMTRREAEKAAKVNRIIGGLLCQVWTADEAAGLLSRGEIS
jgi:hypothetical protein